MLKFVLECIFGNIEHYCIATLEPNTHIYLIDRPNIRKVIFAIRMCADSFDRIDSTPKMIGPNDRKLLENCKKHKHESVFEHLQYTFIIENFSRSMLQEISRHRIASPSVQSTRWALKKIINGTKNIDELFRHTGNSDIDELSRLQIEKLIKLINSKKIKNDISKYALPESFLTAEVLTINCRSLWNLFNLRISDRALWEFKEVAIGMKALLCNDEYHKLLFT